MEETTQVREFIRKKQIILDDDTLINIQFSHVLKRIIVLLLLLSCFFFLLAVTF